MSISEQKWSKAPWQSFPAPCACQWAQLCCLALKHHSKVKAHHHFNDLSFLYTQHLVRDCLSQERSTLNLRTLQQNCISPVHNLIFRAGSTYRSSPPASPSLWAWAVGRNVHFCSNYLLLLQQPTSPHPKLGWVLNFSQSFSISGSNPSPGA